MTSREQVQALIRAEIDRQRPVEVARRTLELLAESAVRAIDAPPGYQIVGRDGAPRMRREEGAERPFTLADLFDELRRQHPSLFLPPPMSPAPEPPAPSETAKLPKAAQLSEAVKSSKSEAARSEAGNAAAPARDRDWIRLTPETVGPAPAGDAPAGGAPAPPRTTATRGTLPLGGGLIRYARSLAGHRSATRTAEDATTRPAVPPAPVSSGEGLKPAVARPIRSVRGRRRRAPLYAALALVAVVGAGIWLLSGSEQAAPPRTASTPAEQRPSGETKSAAAPRREPGETGTLVPGEAAPQKPASTSLAGVAEVMDTATLKLGGRTVRLFGVETAKGAQAQDLTSYLAGRPVACQPAPTGAAYLCTVDGHDLSEVVLYNGGGRATPEATSDLVEAERHARTEKLGIWRR
ncbi:thermonuclease family protein [Methylobacterium nodulans]|uniref:TNase-like domain-containing protein n=1 Tax=Methylobacterium nodulans (strain LMG 21967 / CNCM I-2342 / ORS 2060) TaxID=460265 RepID=B8IHA4_METNO|nr:hypothetical protein [Methylobacterium nodulans]ACL59796.1 conserved hypothetical protein [Methylobacterium nodulans ORS 2060]